MTSGLARAEIFESADARDILRRDDQGQTTGIGRSSRISEGVTFAR
jgi:hypothetical protein